MATFLSRSWSDYELIDFGSGRKLERFGDFTLDRPEVNAHGRASLSPAEWKDMAVIHFDDKGGQRGKWMGRKPSPDWQVHWKSESLDVAFALELTKFKHVGIFPEQSDNWHLLADFLSKSPSKQLKVLNLFAYTGGASLVAKSCGADVVHVDSVKQVVSWARKNMELSGLDNIRWVVEDAFKFAAREEKRGNTYDAIIMDPPAYGIGAKGERWKLEDNISGLLQTALNLLNPERHLLILNTYSPRLDMEALTEIYNSIGESGGRMECGKLKMRSGSKKDLYYGAVLRKMKY